MSDKPNAFTPTAALLSTSIVAFLSGFMLGIYSIRGYLIPPSMSEERRRNLTDPVESDESDVDVDDSLLDHAPNWANSTDADKRDGLKQNRPKKAKAASAVDPSTSALAAASPNEECKLVLVVRTDLGMTKGKIAAQCSHATLACYKSLARQPATSAAGQVLKRWERLGQAKIAVQTKSQQELLDLMGRARALGLTAEVIQDAGRTQIEAGSMTVLGVGPAPKSLVDQVTGGLKLLYPRPLLQGVPSDIRCTTLQSVFGGTLDGYEWISMAVFIAGHAWTRGEGAYVIIAMRNSHAHGSEVGTENTAAFCGIDGVSESEKAYDLRRGVITKCTTTT
ncbi:uncharacterized protein JN550_003108 [Neoarthrinium moseri]|nr:uncharacterized protein JN550_003108 [Neoarthrinium moseri]KAI1873839.1 hypothetical protein JN550_003108 [Neoarthrinium moseri]